MEVVGLAVSIVSLLQLTSKIALFLSDVQDVSNDQELCKISIFNFQYLLSLLQLRIKESDPDSPWTREVKKLGEPDGPFEQCEQALRELTAKIEARSGLRKLAHTFVASVTKKDIENILSRLERIKSHIQAVLSKDQFDLSKAVKSRLDEIGSRIDEDTMSRRDSEQRRQHSEVVNWISTSDFAAQQSDILARRQEGTGEWFLQSAAFENWLSNPKETLFCPGIPGAGKTMTSAIAIDHLLSMASETDVGVAYVYCNYKAKQEQTDQFLIAAILKQLLLALPCAPQFALDLRKKYQNTAAKPSYSEIFTCIETLLKSVPRSFIVVDALDECAHGASRSGLLAFLKRLQCTTSLCFMVTSRFIPELQEDFVDAVSFEIRADDEDVRRYIEGHFHLLSRVVKKDEALKNHLKESIVRVAEGMFLLVRLHMDSLQDKDTKKAVKDALISFSQNSKESKSPGSIYANAYDEAIERIKSQSPSRTKRAIDALTWAVLATRPLSADELCHALAIDLDDKEFDLEDVPDIEDVISSCAGLMVLDPESGVVRLVHYTAQDYLESALQNWSDRGQVKVALSCLKVAMIFSRHGVPDFWWRPADQLLPLFDYAFTYWIQHVASADTEACISYLKFLRTQSSE